VNALFKLDTRIRQKGEKEMATYEDIVMFEDEAVMFEGEGEPQEVILEDLADRMILETEIYLLEQLDAFQEEEERKVVNG
jgi:hypothetical protein